MKKVFLIIISFLFISCFTEPKKEEKIIENNTETNYEYKEDKAFDSDSFQDSAAANPTYQVEKEHDKLPLETFESSSDIYSHYEGCGCYFSTDKDNFIAGKKYVFFGDLLGKEGNSIELIIDGKIEKLFYEGSKKTSETQLVFAYSNNNHLVGIILERENIENEEATYWSGSISVDNKYFSLVFGMCGC